MQFESSVSISFLLGKTKGAFENKARNEEQLQKGGRKGKHATTRPCNTP